MKLVAGLIAIGPFMFLVLYAELPLIFLIGYVYGSGDVQVGLGTMGQLS